jgi:hypothetical protein
MGSNLKYPPKPAFAEAKVTRIAPGAEYRSPTAPGGRTYLVAPSEPPTYTPGDFILTHSAGFTGALIRFGESLRFRGADAKYAHWSHAALIVSEDGDLIEAVGKGILCTPISHYKSAERYLVHLSDEVASPHDREQAVNFARYWLKVRPRYGYLTAISIAISLVTRCRIVFGFDGQFICSGLVASALERTGTIFAHNPANLTPADLAMHFNFSAPPGTPRGVAPEPGKPECTSK